MAQSFHQATYSIQQVSEHTGLSKQLIRKWEDRYAIVTPQRLDNGYRVYTEQDIAVLTRVISLMDEGYSVKQAATLIKSKQPASPILEKETQHTTPYVSETIQTLIQYGAVGNDVKMLHTLQQANHTLGVKRLVEEIINPFLYEVGELWCEGIWGEYQEALSSLVIRDYLANLRRQLFVSPTAPLIIGSCLPNERHEIPMQLLLLQSMFLGYRSVMLGPAPAPKAIESAIENLHPKMVLLSAITTMPFEDNYEMIQSLDHFAAKHPTISFYLGGPGAMQALKHQQLKNIHLVRSIEEIF
ncbi:MerR family transcriptional regulator [Caryophanon tenue]|uniref:HTH merR-type domain-containing protein n=1 Tax=Caryophanon tenue TaxID=33978 RepID=A0A1C0YLB6_9BACL|nr:MerR family transcriptional regulator [Caryophanon tenue]OCS87950.1 hypothetical protein A6M13_08240 [Caryophanon tenue]